MCFCSFFSFFYRKPHSLLELESNQVFFYDNDDSLALREKNEKSSIKASNSPVLIVLSSVALREGGEQAGKKMLKRKKTCKKK